MTHMNYNTSGVGGERGTPDGGLVRVVDWTVFTFKYKQLI